MSFQVSEHREAVIRRRFPRRLADLVEGVLDKFSKREQRGSVPLKYRLSHFAVRVIAIINIVHLLLSYYPPYFRGKFRFLPHSGDIQWMLVSSLLVPMYVGLETWWMYGVNPSQKRSLLIDWFMAGLWFVLWWAVVLRGIYRYYPFWP
jgi:hypothetical protein